MISLNDNFRFKVPVDVDVSVEINWERVYDFLREHHDISLDGFINNMVSIWESDDDFIKIYSEAPPEHR